MDIKSTPTAAPGSWNHLIKPNEQSQACLSYAESQMRSNIIQNGRMKKNLYLNWLVIPKFFYSAGAKIGGGSEMKIKNCVFYFAFRSPCTTLLARR
jgi:hypothetical protein